MRPALLSTFALAPVALGCAGAVSAGADGVDAEASATTRALVSVERTVDATGARAEANARFLRVLGGASPEVAFQAIGASIDLPAAGTCAALAAHVDAHVDDGPSALPIVELVDVGGVTVEAAGLETRLSPRQLPDVTDVVSGVVYARATDPSWVLPGAPFVVHVAGAGGVDGFGVSATAAGDPVDVHIEGEGPLGSVVTIAASATSLEVSWPSEEGDLVYVDVRPAGSRCTLGDAGRATLPSSLLSESGALVVHRLRRESFRARGIDSGEIRFDLARTVPYVRR